MADFPEKDNLQEEEDGFSTVFSDPAEHRKITQKPKKAWLKVLAGILSLCILIGGTVAVVKLIPVLEEDTSSTVSINEITVKNLKTENVSAVTVTNKNGTIELYSKAVKESEESEEKIYWYTKQVDGTLTSSSAIEGVVSALTSITANREITEKTSEECGFSNPAAKAEVTAKEGEGYIVEIGASSPDNSGYYLRINTDGKIYLVDEGIYNSLQFSLLDLADTSNISGFTNDGSLDSHFSEGTLSGFDRLTIKGENYPQTLEIVANTDAAISEYYGYLVNAPQKRLAKNIETVLSLYQSGIGVSGAYSYDISSASLKKFGLDKPYLQMTMYVKDKSITYKFASQEDGDYAVIGDDSRIIHRVSASTVQAITALKLTDYYENTIFLTSIDNINNFTVKTAEKTYSFNVSKNEADEDGEEPEQSYNVTIDGKTLVSDDFQNYYAECLGLKTNDFTVENVTGNPDFSIIVSHTDGSKSNIEFTKVSATRYLCVKDGVQMGKVTATSINRIIKLTDKTANGKTID